MEFVTPYTHKRSPGEVNSGEIMVETAGYIPAHVQIENYMLAGKRLAEYRASLGEYDFAPGEPVDESFSDVTRDPGFDLADATQATMSLIPRLQQQQEASEAALKAAADSRALEEAKALVEAYNASQGNTPKE